jgi:hypothetical protein
MLLARAEPRDTEDAEQLLHEARAIYRELGMAGPLAKLESEATWST